jgi:hypothetical protein
MIRIILFLSLVSALLCSCISPASTSPIPSKQASVQLSGPADKVELVYFHRPRRCDACIYVEERVGYIVNTFFQEESRNGRLTYQIFDLGDKENAAVANEYCAIGSQLFINTIKDGGSHIKHIDRIWYWDCLDDQELFDKTVKDIIKLALYGEG